MIWHERDGQKHVGHPGGLPGLRHADALGARARAERHPARQRHLRQVRDAAAPRARSSSRARPRCRSRIVRADPGLLAARDAVDGLVARWDDGAAARLFSPNVDLDRPLARAARRARGAGASATGRSSATASSSPRTRCAAAGACAASAATSISTSRMAPTVPPLVQTLGGRVGAASRRPARRRSRPRPPTSSERAAPRRRSARCSRPRPTPRRRCAACGSRRRSTARSATPSRSRATARRRRRCASRAIAARSSSSSSSTPSSGRLARLVLRPAAPDRLQTASRAGVRPSPARTPRGEPRGRAGRAADQAHDRRARDQPQSPTVERARDVAQRADRERRERADAVADAEHHPDDPRHLLGPVGRVERQRHHQREDGAVAACRARMPRATACAGSSAMPIAPAAKKMPGGISSARRDQWKRSPTSVTRHRRDDREDVDRDDELAGVGVRPAALA